MKLHADDDDDDSTDEDEVNTMMMVRGINTYTKKMSC